MKYSKIHLTLVNETCEQYDKYMIKLKKKSTVDEKITIQKEYDGTLSYVSKRYALKAQDKLNAKEKKKRNDARFDKC